jgi:putative nucleotidyltransferase with HDIG domain
MPIADGFAVLAAAKSVDPDLPVVILTGMDDIRMAVEAMKRGASDYVCKPVEPDRLVSAILACRAQTISPKASSAGAEGLQTAGDANELKSLRQHLQTSTSATLHALIAALDLRERETNQHSLRVSAYCVHLAKEMGVSGDELICIERGALLHDIGKIGISDSILLKPGPLTSDEWTIMKTHPELGYRIVNGLGWLKGGDQLVLHHHEHFDGRGYPSGLSAGSIPFAARLFAVIDAYDALTSTRPYRAARGYDEAVTELQRCSGTQFDPSVVSAFCQVASGVWTALAAAVSQRSATSEPT